jgi:hypothetical protein
MNSNSTPVLAADKLPELKDGGDVNALLGTWVNTNQDSGFFWQVSIERDQQGVFWLEAFVVSESEPVNWGLVAMDVHQGPRQQSGFHATYEQAQNSIQLVANYKLGVLVIERFCSFSPSDERFDLIGREFFQRAVLDDTVVAIGEATEDDVPVDLTAFVGQWVNSCDDNQWLERFTLTATDQGWQLQIHTSEFHPSPVPVTSYVDNMGYLAFKADIQLADRQLMIAANTQKALVVMTTFELFIGQALTPDKAENRVYREIFCQPAESS